MFAMSLMLVFALFLSDGVDSNLVAIVLPSAMAWGALLLAERQLRARVRLMRQHIVIRATDVERQVGRGAPWPILEAAG